jgi:hypothetical protein
MAERVGQAENAPSTRRYARLADNAIIEVLRSPAGDERQASNEVSGSETEPDQEAAGGPSRTRTWEVWKNASDSNRLREIEPAWRRAGDTGA